MKKIVIIDGHPKENSFSRAIAESYLKGALTAGHESTLLRLNKLDFDLNLTGDRSLSSAVEMDVKTSQEAIKEADHLVFIYPIWWGTYPALLKGFIDRVFLSGFAYKHDKTTKKLIQLLKGKSARIIVTMDTPKWFYALFYKNLGIRALKQNVLGYCGISKVKTTSFSPIRTANHQLTNKWLVKVENYGLKAY